MTLGVQVERQREAALGSGPRRPPGGPAHRPVRPHWSAVVA